MSNFALPHYVINLKPQSGRVDVAADELIAKYSVPVSIGGMEAEATPVLEESTPAWRKRVRGPTWSLDAARARAERYLVDEIVPQA